MQRSHLLTTLATKFATMFEQTRRAADESAMIVASTQPLNARRYGTGERFARVPAGSS
jgi:hypothetical protein